MATYFGIDLGTTQTLIAHYKPPQREKKAGSFELIPIYYEKYEYDRASGKYLSNIRSVEEYAGKPPIMPSLMYLDERTGPDGKTHICRLVGDAAKARVEELGDYGGRFYTNAKSKLESDYKPDENGITAEDVIYELLLACFQSISKYVEQNAIGFPRAIIEKRLMGCQIGVSMPLATNPEFSRVLLTQARQAALDAGFNNVDDKIQLIEEPTAALANYLTREMHRGSASDCRFFHGGSQSGIAMVVDLGGGTTDVAVRLFQLTEEGKIEFKGNCAARSGQIIRRADNARPAFGGLDFDDRIASYLVYLFNEKYTQNQKESTFVYGTLRTFNGEIRFRREVGEPMRKRIRNHAEKIAKQIKEAFSDETLEEYESPDIIGLKGDEDYFRFDFQMTRSQYEELIYPLLENEMARKFLPSQESETVERIITQTVADAGLKTLSDLDFVYLTGGTSMMPDVRHWIERYIGSSCQIIWANDRPPEEAYKNCLTDIANGIALFLPDNSSLGHFEKGLSNAVLIDVQNGLPQVLIEKGTLYPNEGRKEDVVPVESVVGIRIRLYSAPSAYSEDLRILGEYRIDRNKVIPPGTMLSFRYYLDVDKQITLIAFYKDDRGQEKEARLDLQRLN